MPQWQLIFSLSVRVGKQAQKSVVAQVAKAILDKGYIIREIRNEGVMPFARRIAAPGKDRVPHSHGRFIYMLFWANDSWPVEALRGDVLSSKTLADVVLTKAIRPFKGGYYLYDEFVHPLEIENTKGIADVYPDLKTFRARTNGSFESALREANELLGSEAESGPPQDADEPRNLLRGMPKPGEDAVKRSRQRQNAWLREALGLELMDTYSDAPSATRAAEEQMFTPTTVRDSRAAENAQMKGMRPAE